MQLCTEGWLTALNCFALPVSTRMEKRKSKKKKNHT